ncbi:MAG: GGDEF domain-containing protein [Campylobacterales bacterium]|nr:GGDEF domain-containing protein [Campylobacterales bacterium]
MLGAARTLMTSLDPLYHESRDVKQAFREWDKDSRTVQIRSVTFLTALLYIIFSFIDREILTGEALSFAMTLHLYFLPPLLFLISAMTYAPKLYRIMTLLLALAPLLANLGNLYLSGMSPRLAEIYSPEIYLSIIWMFAISGLRFLHALISASVAVAASVAYHLSFDVPDPLFHLHLLWISSAYSFGVLSALILDRTNKRIFMDARELEHLATTDKLSGLYNRMKIESFCVAEIERAKRYQEDFSIILLDIDYFKTVNDIYGHNAGDRVIENLSKIMTESVRSVDKVGRWGGEEFLILLPETSLDKGFAVAEHLRIRISEGDFSPVPQVRISAGVTAYRNGDTVEKMVQRADEGLYRAKEGGRNRSCKV